MEKESFTLTWEDDGAVVQNEEVISMEEELITTDGEEYVTEEQYEPEFETEEIIDDVGIIEEEIIEDDNIETEQEITLETEQAAEEEFMYLSDDNILIMNDTNDAEPYTQDELMQVTEEVITEPWDEACPEEIIIGSEEAVGSVDGQLLQDEDIPLPTNQDSYTASRPYPCDFCSKRFRKKANLMNHMLAHQTDRPHDCHLCGVRYMRKSDLINHLKDHAVAPDSVPLEEDQIFEEQSFEADRRTGNYGKRRRKRDDYFNEIFSAGAETSENRLNDSNSNIEYYTEGETAEMRYPVTDPRKPFVCQHCGVGFAREKALASHARIHGGDSPFECQKCGEMFWDMRLMQEHAKTKHGEIEEFDYDDDEDYSDSEQGTKYGTFYCNNCGLSFHRQDNLRRHQRIHIKEEYVNEQEFGHMCNVCGECFNEALDLLAHAEVHARGSEHRCMMCGEICVDESSLANHVQTYHKNLPPHTCARCGRTCRDGRALFKHSWEHSKEKSFACNQCTKTFHNKARLKRHMLSHRNKVVTCDICNEDFPDGRTLMNHRHSHTNISGRHFPCRECGKTFGSRSSQQIHIRIHTGERPYGCRFCWKAFADGGTLRKHERIHTGEKPYACAVCPRAFNQRVVLREHIRSHHSGPDPKFSQSTTPYSCSVCSDRFVASQDLIVHLIQHCDMNTALKRQPQVGPRKYKRRRKLKPHELELMSSGSMPSFNMTGEPIQANDLDEDGDRKRKTRRAARKTSLANTSPKTSSANESIEEIYEAVNIIESPEVVAVTSKSPTSKNKFKKTKVDSISVPSRPKMIHTQKTRVAVETGEDGRVRHKTKTMITRTQPAEIKSAIGERIRPRTKNVNYHVLTPEKYALATFPTSETEEAVENVLNETITEFPGNGEFLTEEIIEETPDVAAEQIVESESPVPVGLVEVRSRRSSSRISKNVIGPGSKVRLVKEGMIISKMKRNSESHAEPESILPDYQSPEMSIKQETYTHFTRSIKSERNTRESVEEESYDEYQNMEDNADIENANLQSYNTNIKREVLDPSALHELAEVSLQHAQNSANYYKCEMCDEVFTDRSQLLVHVPVHI